MTKIASMQINYLTNPIGLTTKPQFSWVIESSDKNLLQTAYQLQIAKDPDYTVLVYDSGLIESEESAHIFADDFTMQSASYYYVHVRIQDNHGNTTLFSNTAFFLTGLLDSSEWKAPFISAETKDDSHLSKGTYLRKEFNLTKPVRSALAYSTALGLYHLHINGNRIGSDELAPGWTSYHKHLLYQTYDVTAHLQQGPNAIGAIVGAGWYKGLMGFTRSRNIYGDQTAFSCQLMLTYEDGSQDMILTDDSWTGADSPILFSEIYDGEVYDARLELPGWDCIDYPYSSRFVPSIPFHNVEIIPYDTSVLTSQEGSRVTEITPVPARRIFTTPEGDTVIDFGQNMTGWIHFQVQGQAGDVVELNCFEVLDSKGNVYLDNLRGIKETIHYTLKDSSLVEFHPHFTFQGFQYARIASYPSVPKPENFTAYAVHSQMDETGTFECSNPYINQLQHNIIWGLKSNFVDVPTDCPQRDERLGWTGDAQIFCRTASYLMNTYTFFSKWLHDVEADQTPEGGVAHVVPDIVTGREQDNWLLSQGTHSAAAWADVAVIAPWTLYLTYGDKEIIHKQYRSMKAWIEFMHSHTREDGIWNYKLQFGDWVALDAEEGSYYGATPNDLTCTAYYAYSTQLFARMAAAIGKTEDALTYQSLYEEIKHCYQTHFFHEDGTLTANTQTAHIISLYFDLVPDSFKQTVTQGLLTLLAKENGHLVTGFVGTPYFCHALSQNGCIKEAYDLLLKDDFPSWLYQVKMGATTIWEHWDGLKPDGTMWSPDMNSFNHYAYGAIGEWLYRVVAGLEIDTTAPGYKHTILHPHIGGGLTYVKATYQSIYGPLTMHWEHQGNTITIEVTIPANTTADLILPRVSFISQTDDLTFQTDGDNKRSTLGSGHYRITYQTM